MKYKFDEVPKESWPVSTNNSRVLRCFVNKRFLVQIIQDEDYERITINRTRHTIFKGQPIWEDGITWDDLQAIKDAIGYSNSWCVECYPPSDDVINVANMRHLWVLNQTPDFGWKP